AGAPRRLVPVVDLWDPDALRVEQVEQLVAHDLALVLQRVRDPLDCTPIQNREVVGGDVGLSDDLRGDGSLPGIAEHAGDRICVEGASAPGAAHDLAPDLLEPVEQAPARLLRT